MKRKFVLYAVMTALLLLASAADALTVAEILALKKAGVSDETLQMLIERERDEKIMALRAGTWKLSDGRTVYATEGLPNLEAEAPAYVPCISPVIDVPLRRADPKKK
jgi:hypothetical protein